MKESEARAQLLVEKIKIFIEAKKHPVAELDLVLANLAEKNVAVLAAVQYLIASKHSLGLSLGLPLARSNCSLFLVIISPESISR